MGLKTFTIDFSDLASKSNVYSSYKFQFFNQQIKHEKSLLKSRVLDYSEVFTGYALKVKITKMRV